MNLKSGFIYLIFGFFVHYTSGFYNVKIYLHNTKNYQSGILLFFQQSYLDFFFQLTKKYLAQCDEQIKQKFGILSMSDVNETMAEANETSSCDFTIKLPQKLRSTFGLYWFFEKFNVIFLFMY